MFVVRPDIKDIINTAFEGKQFASLSSQRDEFPSALYLDNETGDLSGIIFVPGFSKDDISATFDKGYFVISGASKKPSEIWSSSFKKKFKVDTEVFDVSTTKVSVSEGVLRISLKRKEQNPKTISFEVE